MGETNVRVGTRIEEHASNKASAICKHAASKQIEVKPENFEIIEKGFPKVFDRKLAEALYIREYKPNEQVKRFKLRLFN